MRSTVVVGYAYAAAAFFYAIQNAFGLGLRYSSLIIGFVVGLGAATFCTRGGRP